MKINIKPLFIVALAWFAATVPAHAAEMTEAKVNELIGKYIENNPEKILNVLNTYMAKQQQADTEKTLEDGFKNPVKDTIHDYNPVRGAKNAPITIIAYSDFQCPFCDRVVPTLNDLMKRYEGKVRVVHKNLPLEFHAQARPAARAAMAAAEQGKFWEYYDRLFANQQNLSDALYTKIAEELKLDMKKFKADMASKKVETIIDTDLAEAQKAGGRGTPYFLINGVPISGALPVDSFAAVVDRLLKAK